MRRRRPGWRRASSTISATTRFSSRAPNGIAAYADFFDVVLRELGAALLGRHRRQPPVPALPRHRRRIGNARVARLARQRRSHPARAQTERAVGDRSHPLRRRTDGAGRRPRARSAARIDDQRRSRRDDGRPLTLGDLKRLVSREISRLGMVEDHDTILSQGRDAGMPHSRGDAEATSGLGADRARYLSRRSRDAAIFSI